MLPIETPRLVLRELRASDFEDVHRYAADPQVTRHMLWGPNDPAATRDFLARAEASAAEVPRRCWELAIVLRAEGRVIGSCGLYARRELHREWEVGYVLAASHWRRGLGSEAIGALVDAAFASLGAHRVYATLDPANAASARLLRRLGFRLEGHQRGDTLVRGRWRDSLVFARLEPDVHVETLPGGAGAPELRLETTTQPAASDVEALGRGLTEHGTPVTGSPGFQPLAIFVRDAQGALLGGCSGQVSWSWLHVALLWLDPSLRGRGVGRALLRRFEEEGRRRGCTDVHLDTFSWQAAPFYERLGYRVFATLEDYPAGQRRFWLRKRLEREDLPHEDPEGGPA